MPVIKKTAIRNANTQVYEERDLGAEAQNIDVSFDSNGTIIENVTDPTAVADVEPLSTVLKDIESDVSTNTTNISNITSGDTKINGVKLGTSGSGSSKTYGYYKDGSSTITPFRNPTGDATSAHVRSGYTFSNANSDGLTGSILNLNTSDITVSSGSYNSLNAGGTATIPSGKYVASNTVITAKSLAAQTGVDSGKSAAGAGQILSGYQAWVNGSKVSGTMSNYSNGAGRNATLTSSDGRHVYNARSTEGYWIRLTNSDGQNSICLAVPNNGYYTTNDIIRIPSSYVPNYNTETYTFPEGHTGGTVDLQENNNTRYVNAQNVYSKGYGDGQAQGHNDKWPYNYILFLYIRTTPGDTAAYVDITITQNGTAVGSLTNLQLGQNTENKVYWHAATSYSYGLSDFGGGHW